LRSGNCFAARCCRPISRHNRSGQWRVLEKLRPCHDLRVTAITSDAIAGAHPIAIMTKAGHGSMATTQRYLKLAGVVFREEARAQEARLLGASLSTERHTDLSEPQPTSDDPAPRREAETTAVDGL
jgi:hypothetical protein